MDFFRIAQREQKDGTLEIFPDFIVGRTTDLMVRGRSFYAIWDEEAGIWSTDEYDVQRLVDGEIRKYMETQIPEGTPAKVKYMASHASGSWNQSKQYLSNLSDNSHQLDDNLTFRDDVVKKTDYVSRRLPYALTPGPCNAWDELIGTLYSVEERAKIGWAIGAVISGDAKKIQKFLVFYGPAGTGKSTVLDVVDKMFVGYTTTFDAKALGSNNGSFATEAFKHNPLVAIQHDGDLSTIEDNTRLNSITSHEYMQMNEKYKPQYTARVNAFLFMGTNKPVKITDAKSGLTRRLFDVHPTGVKIPVDHYLALIQAVDFELGAIAAHCLDVYRRMGKSYYAAYRPVEMMLQTDVFFNFIEAHFDIFKEQDGCTLKQAYELYKTYCANTGIDRILPQYKMREELRNYFAEYHDRYTLNGSTVRSYYVGFSAVPFKAPVKDLKTFRLVMDDEESLLDDILADQPAQYANAAGTPKTAWSEVKTTLADLDTSRVHYVKVPKNHIIIDFDLKGEDGGKSLERNLEAASVWPVTYAEVSKGGAGIHLHYHYEGDTSELAPLYSEGIEVKVYTGDSSLRRRLSKCNSIPVATFTGSLPKKEKKVLGPSQIKSEKGLRDLINRNLRKEILPGTKSSIDFIKKILDDAYETDLSYDVSDMKSKVATFAGHSSNHAFQCLKVVQRMQFVSKDGGPNATLIREERPVPPPEDDRIVFFDVEVYSNLFVVCWKFKGADEVVRMINPTPQEVEQLFRFKLVGFFNRPYDNHIMYGRYLGYDNAALFKLSQRLVSNERGGGFGEAYNLSYADIYEFSSIKQSLKKFEIDLGLKHIEMDIPWDQPVKDEDIPRVVEYCVNDVEATEAVFNDREGDFVARQILAELSGLSMNDTTPKHTAKIIFGGDKRASQQFVYTDLATTFPGYTHGFGKSEYRGEDPGEGGYVYAEPGIYHNVALLDVASMHPTSLVELNYFGEYTKNFEDLLKARLAIKAGDYDAARQMLGGRLAPYLTDTRGAKELSYALKIVINIVYGLTSAKFDNPFRNLRNVDNIVAKRGALFMIDLRHFVQEQGYTVVHIKTDSIKIANADPEIIEAVFKFGQEYGYTFEHEATYDRIALVNDAVYIARYDDKWTATGKQFAHPYVYKTLFSEEEITFDDLCETKQVQKGSIHIRYEEGSEPVFIGRIGRFIPVLQRGGTLLRIDGDKTHAVAGTKGYLWMESTAAKALGDEIEIDTRYHEKLVQDAVNQIAKFGDFADFVNPPSYEE